MKFKLGKFEFSLGKQQRHQQKLPRNLRGKYDAATTNHMNRLHWANSDGLSADEANNPEVRRILRNRSRYERANNPYLDSMAEDLAKAVIGTGPRIKFKDSEPEVNRQVENAFQDWFDGQFLGDKLLTGYNAVVGDGEMFLVEKEEFNQRSPVTLAYQLVECDRCMSAFRSNSKNNIDGVVINDNGTVVGYQFSKTHPGDRLGVMTVMESDLQTFRADQVIHFYKKSRPEQHRGIPEITSALPIGSKLRAFTLATLEAAKIAATFSGVLHTTGDAFNDEDSEGTEDFEAFDTFALDNGMMLTLPEGWDMTQAKAEHPTTTYKDFKRELVAEAARSLGMPYNVAAGDSSGFNFASAKMDSLMFRRSIKIRQNQINNQVLWKVFMKWFDEAVRIPGLLPTVVTLGGYQPKFQWFYDGDFAIDPQKEARAVETNLQNGATTHFDVYAEKGQDVRVKFLEIAEAKNLAEKLGILDIVFPVEAVNGSEETPQEAAEAAAEENAEERVTT